MSSAPPLVWFIDDVARELGTSARTIRRLRATHQFPIPEIKGIDNRPRWSVAVVRRFIDEGHMQRFRLRRAS